MSNVTVEKHGTRWVANATYEQRNIPKSAGFRWDPAKKYWYTTDAAIAGRLSDPEAYAAEVAKREAEKAEKVEASRQAVAEADIPCPEGLAYLPYQRAGIATGVTRPAILFGDEMGLGKTIQAIGVINADESIKRVLVICPASLRLNWQRELNKWLTRKMRAEIASGSFFPEGFGIAITIINYDILSKHQEKLARTAWDLVIVDEAHYLKSKKAKRSEAVFGIDDYTAKRRKCEPTPGITARRKIALTGTPIPNRPVEGFNLFHWLDPVEFKSFFTYAKRYCDGHNNGYGWDFKGASHLDELQLKLRGSIMVRRLKADVLKELPAKRRCIVEFDGEGLDCVQTEMDEWEAQESEIEELRVLVELAKASEDEDEYTNAVLALRERTQLAFTEMSKLRHQTALAILPMATEHIMQSLSEEGHKVVVMGHHKDVIAKLMESLREEGIEAVSLTGETPMEVRQANVDRFQSDPDCRVFVGNIIAAGVGITLTAAAHVIFVELDWVPGNMTQAEDRCHRIGQTDSVLVQHLVINGSLGARMAKTLVEKQDVIDRALDRVAEVKEPVAPQREKAATEGVSRDKYAEIASMLSPEQIAAIHSGLKLLAGMDQDHARSINGIGFSKMDVAIGHSLAESHRLSPRQAALGQKLVNRYRRQLPDEIVEVACRAR